MNRIITNRLSWSIYHRGMWVAVHNETEHTAVARTKAELMGKINEMETGLENESNEEEKGEL